jgi:hypothetical protein
MNLVNELTKWNKLKKQEDQIKEEKDEIREKIGKFLHDNNEMSYIAKDETGQAWTIGYQTSTRRSCDYNTLEEILTEEDFKDIVQVNTYESLVIRKTKKKKTPSEYTNKAPKSAKPNLMKAPVGEII